MQRTSDETHRPRPACLPDVEILEERWLLSRGADLVDLDQRESVVVAVEVVVAHSSQSSDNGEDLAGPTPTTLSGIATVQEDTPSAPSQASLQSEDTSPSASTSSSDNTPQSPPQGSTGSGNQGSGSTDDTPQTPPQGSTGSGNQGSGSTDDTPQTPPQGSTGSGNQGSGSTDDTPQTPPQGSTGSGNQGSGSTDDTPQTPPQGSTGSGNQGSGSGTAGNGGSSSSGSGSSGSGSNNPGGSGSSSGTRSGTRSGTPVVSGTAVGPTSGNAAPSTVNVLASPQANSVQAVAPVGVASVPTSIASGKASVIGESSLISSEARADGLVFSAAEGVSSLSAGNSEAGKASDLSASSLSLASSIAQGGVGSTSVEAGADVSTAPGGTTLDVVVGLEQAIARSAIDGLLRQESGAAIAGVAIKGFDLLLEFMPFDRSSLESAVDQFIEGFESLGLNNLDSLEALDLIPGVLTGTVVLSATVLASKLRQERSDEEPYEDESDETSSFAGFPGLPSLPCWEK